MAVPAFRDEVRAERARSAMGQIVLIRPLSFSTLTATATAMALVTLLYLFIAEYAKKSSLAGTLVPASGAIRVVAPLPGIVQDRRVREGERVAAGEPLLRLVDARSTSNDGPVGPATLDLIERRAAQTRRQLEQSADAALSERASLRSRIDGLQAELRQVEQELEAIEARGELARESLLRFSDLERRGFASAAQRQQKEEDALELRSRRHATLRARLALEREISGLRLAISEAGARSRAQQAVFGAQLASLAQEQVERRAQADSVVLSPATGTVATLLAESGQVVAGGAHLLTLLPEGSPLEAHLFAPSRAIGFIRAGQGVLLRFPAFPYQKFGSHRARVTSVSRSPVPAAELGFTPPDGSREPLYRVKVALEAQSVSAYGRAEPLQAGMQVEADVLLDRRRLIEWVFEPLFSLAGRA
jgi:membrane fusion protein